MQDEECTKRGRRSRTVVSMGSVCSFSIGTASEGRSSGLERADELFRRQLSRKVGAGTGSPAPGVAQKGQWGRLCRKDHETRRLRHVAHGGGCATVLQEPRCPSRPRVPGSELVVVSVAVVAVVVAFAVVEVALVVVVVLVPVLVLGLRLVVLLGPPPPPPPPPPRSSGWGRWYWVGS